MVNSSLKRDLTMPLIIFRSIGSTFPGLQVAADNYDKMILSREDRIREDRAIVFSDDKNYNGFILSVEMEDGGISHGISTYTINGLAAFIKDKISREMVNPVEKKYVEDRTLE